MAVAASEVAESSRMTVLQCKSYVVLVAKVYLLLNC